MTVGLLSITGTPSYQGFVATMGRMLDSNTASFKQANSRSQHVATDTLTSIKLCFQNYYAQIPDSGLGAAATVTASIEYPSGTIHKQITFNGGATSVTIADISTAFSDFISVSIPNGSTFWVRVFYTNANGIVYLQRQQTSSTEQFCAAASGLSDQTMTGASLTGGTSQTWIIPPLAIIGTTRTPSILVLGDSRSVFDAASQLTGLISPSLVPTGLAFVNIAEASSTVQNWLTQATARNAVLPYGSQLINALGVNDLGNGRSAAQVVADIQTVNAQCSAKYKYNTTLPPYTSSTDAWATTANQTVLHSVAPFNNLVRAGFSGQNGFYEIANALTSAVDSDKWVVSPSPPYTLDGLHPATNAGYDLVRNSGVIQASTLAGYP